MVNRNGRWVPRDILKSQTPESLIVLSISYHVIKEYKYAGIVSLQLAAI